MDLSFLNNKKLKISHKKFEGSNISILFNFLIQLGHHQNH